MPVIAKHLWITGILHVALINVISHDNYRRRRKKKKVYKITFKREREREKKKLFSEVD